MAILGEDDPTSLPDLQEPILVSRVAWEVIFMDLYHGAYCAESIRNLSLSECPVEKECWWVKQLRAGAPIG